MSVAFIKHGTVARQSVLCMWCVSTDTNNPMETSILSTCARLNSYSTSAAWVASGFARLLVYVSECVIGIYLNSVKLG